MSSLPQLDLQKVSNKAGNKIAELQVLVFQLETLAEQLRDERDEARVERDKALAEVPVSGVVSSE